MYWQHGEHLLTFHIETLKAAYYCNIYKITHQHSSKSFVLQRQLVLPLPLSHKSAEISYSVQECDATGAEIFTNAGFIKEISPL